MEIKGSTTRRPNNLELGGKKTLSIGASVRAAMYLAGSQLLATIG